MAWVEANGTDIHYIEQGSGQPLVFLHGNGSCAETWFQQFAAFSDRFRVIAYDSVNHGYSSNSPRDEDEPDRADELDAFLAALDIERPILAGNSMGGNTLLRWAARHPNRALALVPSGSGVREADAPQAPPRSVPDSETIFLEATGGSLTDAFMQTRSEMYQRYVRVRSTATRIEALRHPRLPSRRTQDERAALGGRVSQITSPLQIMTGSLDTALDAARRLHELAPSSRLHVIDGGPHNSYYERASDYIAVVEEFLGGLAPDAVAIGVAGTGTGR